MTKLRAKPPRNYRVIHGLCRRMNRYHSVGSPCRWRGKRTFIAQPFFVGDDYRIYVYVGARSEPVELQEIVPYV